MNLGVFEMTPQKAQSATDVLTAEVTLASHTRVPPNKSRAILPSPKADWEIAAILLRLHAGIWSARTALVLSVPFAIVAWMRGAEHVWFMYMLLPVVAAFFSGVFIGAAICDHEEVADESLAGRRGAMVALLAYVIFSMEVAVLSDSPIEGGLNVLMGSLLMTGWAVFPVAFLAGILAFRAREGARRHRHEAKGQGVTEA
jgi:hypothetical protein